MSMIYNVDYSPFKKLTLSQYKRGIPSMDSFTGMEGLLNMVRPKDREGIRIVLSYDPTDILMNVMYYAGIGTSNNVIIDNDTRMPLPYNNKFMRYPAVSTNNKDTNIVNFDPLFNLKMMEIVFSVYISKIAAERRWSIRSFYVYGRQTAPKTAEICFNNGTKMVSDQFITDTVCYINLMMIIEGVERSEAFRQCSALDQYIRYSKLLKGKHYE